MALSDYLTGDEWDACLYASFDKAHAPDFGASMYIVINKLLAAGHVFPGLDENGNKKVQVENGINASKLLIFLGNPDNVDVLPIVSNGRKFLKDKCPELLGETDEQWEAEMKELETLKNIQS